MTHDATLALASALVEFTAPVTQILDHMARAPGADATAAAETLRHLLADVLTCLQDRLSEEDLRLARLVVDSATGVVISEIHLVPHDPAPADRNGRDRRR